MTTITNFNAFASDGTSVAADAHGNNVAFQCLACRAPVLAVLMQHQRGTSPAKPTTCRHCGAGYWIEAIVAESRLVVHRVAGQHSGRYWLGREPHVTAGQNAASWSVVSAMLNAYGGADYEDFSAAVRQHDHPAGGRAFIDYCIRNGWLVQA